MDYLYITADKIPPIEGGYYEKPLRVLSVSPVDPNYITIEYEDGSVASGMVLTGADAERFIAAQKEWLAKSPEEKAYLREKYQEWLNKPIAPLEASL